MSGGPRSFSEADLSTMRACLRLAERGRGTTWPNPIVGSLVVARDGRTVVGKGHHKRAGGPHAEVVALTDAGPRAAGGTLYVTLEPCCHTGRTGPCTEAILAAGIRRVLVGCRDENPKVAGKGIQRLRRAGVKVEVGCLEEECRRQNRAFFRWIRDGRPAVTLKAAATLDGFIAPRPAPRARAVHWITGEPARARAHALRAEHQAILVGAGTVRADDPLLTVRLTGRGASSSRRAPSARPPLRVVLDGRLRMPVDARLLRATSGGPALVIGARPARASAATLEAIARRQRALVRAGGEVVLLPGNGEGQVAPKALLRHLASRGVQSLLVEGGATVLGAFIAARLVDSVALFLAPRLQGGGVPLVESCPDRTATGPLPWDRPLRLGAIEVQHLAGDILLRADVIEDPVEDLV